VDKDVCWWYTESHDVRHLGEAHYFEVRHFRGPHADRELRTHDGRNTRIQDGLVGVHRYKFHVLAKRVTAIVRDAVKSRRRGVAFAFRRNRGKHRSVATAELMAAVFATKFWNVVIEHVALDRWGNRCRCEACSRLLPPQDLLEAASGRPSAPTGMWSVAEACRFADNCLPRLSVSATPRRCGVHFMHAVQHQLATGFNYNDRVPHV
jgi:hypothetical protein